MSSILEFFEEELVKEDATEILFVECFGENILTDPIRQAICCATVQKFGGSQISEDSFEQADLALAKSITFHGPYIVMDDAVSDSSAMTAVIVAPTHLWEKNSEFVYLAVLSN